MKTPEHIYIAGPMRNHDAFNFPAFFAAEAYFRGKFPGADICNPAREDIVRLNMHDCLAADPTGYTAGAALMNGSFTQEMLRDALGQDLFYVCRYADVVVLLPGWQESKGAVAEAATAQALGILVVEWNPLAEEDDLPEPEGETPLVASEDRVQVAPGEEVRVTSSTGGEKGQKLAAFDQVSPEVEVLIAEHFGKGAKKYAAHNFRNGYPWSLSYSALRRHLAAFWAGEEYDDHLPDCPEGCTDHTGSLHIVAVCWHAMVLTEFFLHHKEHDDRYVYPKN